MSGGDNHGENKPEDVPNTGPNQHRNVADDGKTFGSLLGTFIAGFLCNVLFGIYQSISGHWSDPSSKVFIFLLGTFFCFGLFEYLTFRGSSRKKALCCSFICWAVFIVAPVSAWTLLSRPESDFSISTGMTDAGSGIWYVEDSCITPIQYTVLVDFVNLSPLPFMIKDCCIMQEETNGIWTPMDWVPSGINPQKTFYAGWNLKDVREIQFETFAAAIQGKNIAPNETVSGWVFFTKKPVRDWKNYRFWIKDTTGRIHQEYFNANPNTGYTEHGPGSQPMGVKTTTNHADISGLRIFK